jgi:diaminopimelate epimerase
MHGTFNDFVILDNRLACVDDVEDFARFVCERHGALGADGLLVIESSGVAHARMRTINADGSEAEMCGNGMRCVARFLEEAGEGDRLRIETPAGIVETIVVEREPEYIVRIEMGTPLVQRRALSLANAHFVSLGNPHVVIFERSLDALELPAVAASLQLSPMFPEGTNVHLAVHAGPQALAVRHWERGVGLTMSCGTGAVACAAAAITSGLVRSPVEVRVPGGRLTVEWDGRGPAYLSGPAVRVFDGELHAADVVRA